MIDKALAAKFIRARLESRIGFMVGCRPNELPPMKIGVLISLLFLLAADAEVGAFRETFQAVLTLIGAEEVWREPDADTEGEQEKKERGVIN